MQRKCKSAIKTRATVLFILPVVCLVLSCTRNEVEFGTVPENSYTRLVFIDSVGVQLSTVIIDSFSTGNAASFLIGKYTDPYLGLVSTKPFFQLNKPTAIPDISNLAVFDSLTCILRANKYYYGDTTAQPTVSVNELAQDITLSYNYLLYNTSNVNEKPVPLGSRKLSIRPSVDDSIFIRLDDAKGQELFSKLSSKADEVSNTQSFQYYFKGLSLSTGANDTSFVFGIKDTVIMRLNYHYNDPFPVSKSIDFVSQVNTEAFNQILANRAGTGLVSTGRIGITEIPSALSNHYSYTQPGTGLYLKMIFPTLKGVIENEDIVRLLKAELLVRPVPQSFDRIKIRLPSKLFLIQTDGSNTPGVSVTSPVGGVQFVDPTLDNLFNVDNFYSFDITSNINTMINSPGTEDQGFYVVQGYAGSTLQMDRIVAGDATTPGLVTQLKLSVLVIKK